MKTIQSALFALILSCTQSNSFAQSTDIASKAGYGTGNGWKNTSSLLKEPWVQGFIDGFLAANYVSNPKGETEWLTTCIRGMKTDQIVAIIDKYLVDHPAEWHKAMSLSALAALKDTCRK